MTDRRLPIAGAPPPEVFQRTAERRQQDRERLEREVADMKARGVDATLPTSTAGAPSVGGIVLDLGLELLRKRSADWQSERRSLVCWRTLYPAGAPEGFLDADLETDAVMRARRACGDAGARPECRYRDEEPTCLWLRATAIRDRAHANLSQGLGTEAQDEHALVLRAFDVDRLQPLKGHDPMAVVRRWLAGERAAVAIKNGAELNPLTGEQHSSNVVHVVGNERLLVFGGNPGRGKSVAAIYSIARLGGQYALDYALSRPFDVDAAVAAKGVVVLDQIQPHDPDEARRASRRAEEIVHRRFAAGRKTMLVGNVDWLTFARRYGSVEGKTVRHPGVIAERCAQSGLFVLFGGPSLRAVP